MSPHNDHEGRSNLPMLLDQNPMPALRTIRRCLKYIDRWRQYLFRSWLRTMAPHVAPPDVAATVDQLVSIALLVEFIDSRPNRSPDMARALEGVAGLTVAREARDILDHPPARTAPDRRIVSIDAQMQELYGTSPFSHAQSDNTM